VVLVPVSVLVLVLVPEEGQTAWALQGWGQAQAQHLLERLPEVADHSMAQDLLTAELAECCSLSLLLELRQ
jgi:hypothetical protein